MKPLQCCFFIAAQQLNLDDDSSGALFIIWAKDIMNYKRVYSYEKYNADMKYTSSTVILSLKIYPLKMGRIKFKDL